MSFGSSDRPGRPPQARPRSRARVLVPLAVAVWAVLEIWLLTVVAGAIGGWLVLLLLLAGFVFGAAAVKHAGRRAWNSLAAAVRTAPEAAPYGAPGARDPLGPRQPVPTAEGAGTAMLGGLLLIVPGFVSDAAGLLCLFPPTRELLTAAAGRLGRRLGRRGLSHPPGSFGEAFQQARMRMPDGKVVPGEVVRDDGRPGGPDGRGHSDDRPRPPLTP
jgi:UPF0716 protein FxsA